MQPASPAAYKLLHLGALALSKMESIGIPVDESALTGAISEVRGRIRAAEDELRSHRIYYEQRKKFGAKANVNSRNQLAYVLYNVMGCEGAKYSDKGNVVLDDEVLDKIPLPYCQRFQKLQKLKKLEGTYLSGMADFVCDGRIHGFFNLHKVSTYRSSADSPNLQNIPVRDPEIGGIIRSIVRPKDPNYCIVEVDYSALEVHIAACYHKDPTMIDFLETDHDMHADAAAECFLLDKQEKPIRTACKALFVFANFYGDYYGSIAEKLWNFASRYTMQNGTPLLDHLKNKGITHLGNPNAMATDSFMQHIHDACERFWKDRFSVYDKWRKEWFEAYQRNGYFHTLTGFRYHGVAKRNFVINSPVQGSAFHCLLLSCIEMTRRLESSAMRANVICQIHDSLLAEVHKDDVEDYCRLANDVMTLWIRKQFPWIILRLKTEAEVGESWATKRGLDKWLSPQS